MDTRRCFIIQFGKIMSNGTDMGSGHGAESFEQVPRRCNLAQVFGNKASFRGFTPSGSQYRG